VRRLFEIGVGGQAGLEIGGNALREAGVDLGLGDLGRECGAP
jgi:hypothetical protein